MIIRNYPPNFKQIVKVLPSARNKGIIFSYGNDIYAPTSGNITPHLLKHEAAHGERQNKMGVEFWWDMYLNDIVFRYNEELIAHRVEFQSMIDAGLDYKMSLHMVARRLSSSLYGCRGGFQKALRDIGS